HHFLADPLLNNLVESDKRATTNEQNFLGVDLYVFLVRMFAAALRRNIAGAAFENLQERLLHAFAGNISRDRDVVGLAADLVDHDDINNADLSALHDLIRIMEQA